MTASVCAQEADNHALNHVSTRLCDKYTGCAVTFALHQGGLFVCVMCLLLRKGRRPAVCLLPSS